MAAPVQRSAPPLCHRNAVSTAAVRVPVLIFLLLTTSPLLPRSFDHSIAGKGSEGRKEKKGRFKRGFDLFGSKRPMVGGVRNTSKYCVQNAFVSAQIKAKRAVQADGQRVKRYVPLVLK